MHVVTCVCVGVSSCVLVLYAWDSRWYWTVVDVVVWVSVVAKKLDYGKTGKLTGVGSRGT